MSYLLLMALSFSIILFLLALYCSIPWIVHRKMTIDNSSEHISASYFEFKKRFNLVSWRYYHFFPGSLFEENYTCTSMVHAGVVLLDSVGLVLRNPIDYYLAKRHVKSFIEEHFKGEEKYEASEQVRILQKRWFQGLLSLYGKVEV